MQYGQPVLPSAQPIDTGLLVRLFKANGVGTSNQLAKFGAAPVSGKLISSGPTATQILAIEGGFGISTANAENYWGKPGSLLRKQVRIDKCPWPDGQTDIRIRVGFDYAQLIGRSSSGGHTESLFSWPRNTSFSFSMTASAPATAIQEGFGFGPGSGSATFNLQARGVGAGQPLVQDDQDPFTDTFVTLDVTDPIFTQGSLYWYSNQDRHHMLPCPQWSTHHINFPGDAYGYFSAASFAHGAIGLVLVSSWEVEAVGWDTGADDDRGFLDPMNLDPQGYEPPNPPPNPFNPDPPY